MYQIQTEGMTCQGCVRSITSAIKTADTDAQVRVDLKTQKVEIETEATEAEIRTAFEEVDYPILQMEVRK